MARARASSRQKKEGRKGEERVDRARTHVGIGLPGDLYQPLRPGEKVSKRHLRADVVVVVDGEQLLRSCLLSSEGDEGKRWGGTSELNARRARRAGAQKQQISGSVDSSPKFFLHPTSSEGAGPDLLLFEGL